MIIRVAGLLLARLLKTWEVLLNFSPIMGR